MTQIVKEPQLADSAVDTRYPGLAQVKAIVAFASAKGGTGKSTIATNLAAALASKGRKIGIADADLGAPSVAAMLGLPRLRLIGAKGGVDPANGPFGIRIIANDPASTQPPINFAADDAQWEPGGWTQPGAEEFTSVDDLMTRARFGALDLLMVDLAPGFASAVLLSELIERAGVVMVLPASAIAIDAARRALEEARCRHVRIVGLIENMQGFYCGSCHSMRPLLPRSDVGALARDFDLPILGRIPFDSRVAESCDNGRPFVREYPEAPVAKLLSETAANLLAAVSAPATAPQNFSDRLSQPQ